MSTQEHFDKYVDNYSFGNKLRRLIWNVACIILYRPFSLPIFKGWRNFVLRCFGAQIGQNSYAHSSAKIWAPWNLEIGQHTCIGPHTIIYNPGKIVLGNKVTISQYAYLCTASHDYTSPQNTLFWKPIVVHDFAWVAAKAFICPGVTIGDHAVIGACTVLTHDAEPFGVYGGNPAKFIKRREMKE